MFISLSSFDDDPDAYAQLADNWEQYGVFGNKEQATAFRPPLYPWTLKELKHIQSSNVVNETQGFRRLFNKYFALSRNASIALWHWTLGLLTVTLVYRLARYTELTPFQSSCAGLLVALDPILLQQSRFVMTETLAAFFSVIMLASTVAVIRVKNRKYGFIAFLLLGIVYGLSTLCRPAFFAFVGLVFLTMTVIEFIEFITVSKSSKNSLLNSGLRLSCFLLGVACISIPWSLRNLKEFHQPILTTTHGGYTLYLANNPEIYEHFRTAPMWSLWDPESFHKRRAIDYQNALDAEGIDADSQEAELFQDRWTKSEAHAIIKAAPKVFLYSCCIRAGELWRVFPHDVEAELSGRHSSRGKTFLRYGVALFYSIELSLALLGLLYTLFRSISFLRRSTLSFHQFVESPIIWGVLLILSVQIPHLIYWTNMRMRAPLETFIPILTIIGTVYIINHVRPPKNNMF